MASNKTWRSVVGLCVLAGAAASAGWSKTGNAEATFKATGPAGFKIVGKTSAVDVADDGTSLTVTVKLKEIDTDNSLRNGHMQEDLEAEKFPLITLKVPLASLKVPDDGKSVEAESKGVFGLHGQTKEIPFKYKASCKGGACDVEGSADINLKDYGVKVRSYLGITVKPEVSVATKFQVKK
ncbi:MAG: YceI family protein [Myxococcota bacterium]